MAWSERARVLLSMKKNRNCQRFNGGQQFFLIYLHVSLRHSTPPPPVSCHPSSSRGSGLEHASLVSRGLPLYVACCLCVYILACLCLPVCASWFVSPMMTKSLLIKKKLMKSILKFQLILLRSHKSTAREDQHLVLIDVALRITFSISIFTFFYLYSLLHFVIPVAIEVFLGSGWASWTSTGSSPLGGSPGTLDTFSGSRTTRRSLRRSDWLHLHRLAPHSERVAD